MAKRKSRATDTVQHTSTSEAVKTRPRKRIKNTTLPGHVDTVPKKTPKVEDKQLPIQTLRPIALVHLDELANIWDNDKRIPTAESRRAWALARDIKPDHVHRWWARRKQIAKKARQALPKGTYELPVGIPPVIKNETTPPPDPPVLQERPSFALKTEDDDDIPVAASSDTLVASSPGPHKKFDAPLTSSIPNPKSPLPPSSLSLASSSAPVPNQYVPPLRLPSFGPTLPTTPIPSRVWCTQGRTDALEPSPSSSSFTCALCIKDPTASSTIPEEDPARPATIPSAHGLEYILSDDHMHLGMELSALQFILRSPPDLVPVRVVQPIELWCLNRRSYAFDGSFVGPCVCAFQPTRSCALG